MNIGWVYSKLATSGDVEVCNSEKDLSTGIATYYTLAPSMKRINASKQTIIDLMVKECEVQTGQAEFCDVFFGNFCLVASLKFTDSETDRRKVLCFDLDYLPNNGHTGETFTLMDAELLVADLCVWLEESMTGLGEIIVFEEEPCVVLAGNFADKPVSVHVYFPRLTRLNRESDLLKSHQRELDSLNEVLKKYSLSVDASIDKSGLKLPFMDKKLKTGQMRGACAKALLIKNIELPTFREFFEVVHPYVVPTDATFERTIEWSNETIDDEEEEAGGVVRTRVLVGDSESLIERFREAFPAYEGVDFTIKDGRIFIPQSTYCPLKLNATDNPAFHHGSAGKVHISHCGSTKSILRCFVCSGEIEIALQGLTRDEERVMDYWGERYAKMGAKVLRFPLLSESGELTSYEIMSRKDFFDAEQQSGRTIQIGEGKKAKHIQEHVWALDQPGFPSYPLGLVCDPTGRNDSRQYNTWNGFNHKVLKMAETMEEMANQELTDLVPFWGNMIIHNICGGDDDMINYYLSWHAYLFQNPSRKPRTALVLHGPQGCGKSMSSQFFTGICGDNASVSLKVSNITADFNSIMDGKRYVVVEEALKDGRRFDQERHNTLKNLITEHNVISTKKYHDAQNTKSFSCFTFLSNSEHPVNIETGDRRFVMFDCGYRVHNNNTREQVEFATAVARESEDVKCLAAIYLLLMRRDISNFNPAVFKESNGRWSSIYDGLDETDKYIYSLFLTGDMGDEPVVDNYVLNACMAVSAVNQQFDVAVDDMARDVFGDNRRNYQYPKVLLFYHFHKACPHVTSQGLWLRFGKIFPRHPVAHTFRHGRVGTNRVKTFTLPSQTDCQEAFSRYVRKSETADLRIFNEWKAF